MGRNLSKDEIKEFKNTPNGKRKYAWMWFGIIFDFLSSLGISILIINAQNLPSPIYFYFGLFILLVIVVLSGELIGVYFGAIEQYFYDKYQKKVLDIDE